MSEAVGDPVRRPTASENLVTVALSEPIRPYGGSVTPQFGTQLREGGGGVDPTRLRVGTSGVPQVVVNAKYKAERLSGFPQADLYQMLAYCTVLGLASGHLIYAKGEDLSTTHVVRGSGTRVVAHTLDLAASPQAQLASVAALANNLAAPGSSDWEPALHRAVLASMEGVC